MKIQSKTSEPRLEIGKELLRFVPMLETNDRVVRIAHDNHVAGGASLPPLVDPLIINMMKVDVRQERGGAIELRLPGNIAWRLPQKDELESIVATNCKRPAIDETVFPDTPSIQYWTSTPTGPSYAWVVFFRTGMSTWNFLRTTPFAVRLVRTGQ